MSPKELRELEQRIADADKRKAIKEDLERSHREKLAHAKAESVKATARGEKPLAGYHAGINKTRTAGGSFMRIQLQGGAL